VKSSVHALPQLGKARLRFRRSHTKWLSYWGSELRVPRSDPLEPQNLPNHRWPGFPPMWQLECSSCCPPTSWWNRTYRTSDSLQRLGPWTHWRKKIEHIDLSWPKSFCQDHPQPWPWFQQERSRDLHDILDYPPCLPLVLYNGWKLGRSDRPFLLWQLAFFQRRTAVSFRECIEEMSFG